MEHLWAIVGTGVRPQTETDFVVLRLFGDEDGRAAALEMDRTMAELPGMEGCAIFRHARDEAKGRAAAVPITVEASAVHTASSVESQRACMNSRRWKKLANHLSEKPCGGKVK